MKNFFLLIFFIPFTIYTTNLYADNYSSYNSFGQVGLIQIPSAEAKKSGTINLTFTRNDIYKYGNLSVSPYDWLEASYFYYRPRDMSWGGKTGLNLDKGFNIKFSFRPKNKNIPLIALGLDDFAGTGLFTREYLVSTLIRERYKITLGLGWGKFASSSSYTNPLTIISSGARFRPIVSSNIDQGGNFSYDKWFRGPVAILGGIEWAIPGSNRLKLKVEADPFNYKDFSVNAGLESSDRLRKKESDVNVGFSYAYNKNLDLDFSFIKGNTFNFSFSYGITFDGSNHKKSNFNPNIETKNPDTRNNFYEDLLLNLNNSRLLLQTSEINKKELDIAISSPDYINHIQSSSNAAYIAAEVIDSYDLDINRISITNVNLGIELNKISYPKSSFESNRNTPIELKKRYIKLNSGNKSQYLKNKFKPLVKFPAIFSSFSPGIVSHIGSPQKFYFGGLTIKNNSEIQFSRNLILSSEINAIIYDNFDEKIDSPDSYYLPHVRTDLVKYLQQSNTYISRLQLDYIWSPVKNSYLKLSSGIFETMYGGIGGEFLYKPFNKNYSIGVDAFYVKKRDFNQKFKFLDYETVTGHMNFNYFFPLSGIRAKLSYGKYLARDRGFTLDLSRQSLSGFKSGFFLTKSNVSNLEFGEGGFDKGFYFQIPLDLFSKNYNGSYSNFKLRPLTRDGGAKLEYANELDGLIYNSTYGELYRGLPGLLN